MKCLTSNAKNDRFDFVFEGLEHSATIILLPYRLDTWRLEAKPGLLNYIEVIKAVSGFETVIVCIDSSVYDSYLHYFNDLTNVKILKIDYDDSWARDNTPIFLKKEDDIRAVNFGFNAWGGDVNGLYDSWEKDKLLSNKLSNYLRLDKYNKPDFILEGGSINTNGSGTLITTKACLLSKGRNPKLSVDDIEKTIKKYLNIDSIIWLNHGIYLDETNEHVDNICAFANENTVLLSYPLNETDKQYTYSKDAYDTLINSKTSLGNKINVIKIPSPTVQYMTDEESKTLCNPGTGIIRNNGRRLAASYVNFYQGKNFVILPKFKCSEDKLAYDLFKSIFPNKEIIQIYSREILLGGGNIHCITKEIPYSKKLEDII